LFVIIHRKNQSTWYFNLFSKKFFCMPYDTNVKILSDVDMNNELENFKKFHQ